MQRAWGPEIKTMAQIESECHDNFTAVIRQALHLGINHFETARGYGSSELQFAAVLGSLIQSGEVNREDIIVQVQASL